MSMSLKCRFQHHYYVHFDIFLVLKSKILATSTSFRHLFDKSFLFANSLHEGVDVLLEVLGVDRGAVETLDVLLDHLLLVGIGVVSDLLQA